MRKQRFTDDRIAEALSASLGGVYLAAKALGCSHTTIYERIKKSRKLREVCEDAEGKIVDAAIAGLAKRVFELDMPAIKTVLEYKGEIRGWKKRDTSQVEFSGPNGGPIEMKNERQPVSESERLAELVALCDSIRERATTAAGSSKDAE